MPANKEVLLCPAASLYSLSVSVPGDEDGEMLKRCFKFGSEVGPGWIGYNPDKITVITSNDMFRPMGKHSEIIQPKKKMIRVKNQDDILKLEGLLEKPVLMCVTRRQNCGAPIDLFPSDTENFSRSTVSGFDIDFAVIFPAAFLKQALKEKLELIRLYIAKQQKFCLMFDLSQVFKELTPQELRDADCLEYVSWHNTTMWLKNHCKPHHSLMNINNFLFWTALFPFSFFLALPYRAGRRLLCKDRRVMLRSPMKFKVGSADDLVVVCVWTNDAPPPGEYNKHIDQFALSTAQLDSLSPLLRTTDMITFEF